MKDKVTSSVSEAGGSARDRSTTHEGHSQFRQTNSREEEPRKVDHFITRERRTIKDLVAVFEASTSGLDSPQPRRKAVITLSSQQTQPVKDIGIALPSFCSPRAIVARLPSQEIALLCKPVIQHQMETTCYDRTIYAAEFYQHVENLEKIVGSVSGPQAMESFAVDAAELVAQKRSGHCAALAQNLLRGMPTQIRRAGYVVAGQLFGEMRRRMPGAPEYDHGAAMLRFNSPTDTTDNGVIIFDPSFDFPVPVIVKPSDPFVLKKDGNLWHFSFSLDRRTINCIRLPLDAQTDLYASYLRDSSYSDKIMSYRTDELTNPDTAITNSVLAVDKRPILFVRSLESRPPCMVAISYTRRSVSLRIDVTTQNIPFSTIIAQDESSSAWLHSGNPNFDMSVVPSMLAIDKGDFVRQIWRAVKAYDRLQQLFKEQGIAT